MALVQQDKRETYMQRLLIPEGSGDELGEWRWLLVSNAERGGAWQHHKRFARCYILCRNHTTIARWWEFCELDLWCSYTLLSSPIQKSFFREKIVFLPL
jgi:hypothetical protein